MTLAPSSYEFVRTLVRAQSGISLGTAKQYLVEARLGPLVQREGLSSLDALVARLRLAATSPLHTEVVEAMTTNETSFFRDMAPFEALRRAVVPVLIRRRQNVRRLRIWSAASSTGQEAYSIAMLLRDSFPELLGWRIEIRGTDLSRAVLAQARAGTYHQMEVNRGLSADQLARHFRPVGDAWQVKDELRAMIDFQWMNLTLPWPAIPPQDIIFLRNVLIYFEPDTKRQILRRLVPALAPDGTLLLGAAENPFDLEGGFVRIELGRTGVFERTAASTDAPVAP